jgi:CheY-like chemotaxis protein
MQQNGDSSSVVAGFAHELDNVLSIILAQAVLLEELEAEPRVVARGEKIRSAAERGARLVKAVRALTQQASGSDPKPSPGAPADRLAATRDQGAEMTDGAAVAGRPRAALVVDDEADIREILAEILRQEGYRVDTAQSGQDALARLHTGYYDIVLSDIRMPGMTGMELYRQLKQLRPELANHFIVVSGDDLNGPVHAFLEETSLPFIGKPFIPAVVRDMVAAKATCGAP